MARTIAALFDRPDGAEGALGALMESGLAGHRSRIIGAPSRGTEMAPLRAPDAPDTTEAGEASLDGLGLPASDHAAYASALRQGACLLVADVVGDLDGAIAVVETFDPADLDRHSQERLEQGANQDGGDRLGAGLAAGMAGGTTNTAAVPGMAGMAESTHDSGSGDLRTTGLAKHDMGRSTTATGDMRAEERAGAPGALELGAKPDLVRRDPARTGRVRSYIGG